VGYKEKILIVVDAQMDGLFLRPLMDEIVAWKELEQQVMREKV